IRVPQLPESVADATLVAWHKQPGDAVSRDENLADLETDKVVLEVPAPMNGVLREIRIQGGTTVTSGQVLAVLEEAAPRTGAGGAEGGAGASAAAIGGSAGPSVASGAATNAARAGGPSGVSRSADAEGSKDGGKLSPSVRRLVEEN